MTLVDYSGSEDSDQEEQTRQQEAVKSKATTSKSTFQKVVDRSNPNKIRVNLSELAKPKESDESEQPSKRAKVGSGGFSGFNSLLPAPKRTAAPSSGSVTNGTRRGGLGTGINLKTGAAPGFSREPAETAHTRHDDGEETVQNRDLDDGQQGQEPEHARSPVDRGLSLPEPAETPKLKGKTTMFKPLSVARKPQKKKALPQESLPSSKAQIGEPAQQPKPAPKISLFSTGEELDPSTSSNIASGVYQPVIYNTTSDSLDPKPSPPEPTNDPELSGPLDNPSYQPSDPSSQSLTSIASDLNLTPAQTRQLFGRQRNKNLTNLSSINIVNFSTDAEYAANEILRQAGTTVQHNPVRAIAPGKHSLKQLVNAASNQKDALEESFATGRRNKKEAGSKYGW